MINFLRQSHANIAINKNMIFEPKLKKAKKYIRNKIGKVISHKQSKQRLTAYQEIREVF